MNNLEKRCW